MIQTGNNQGKYVVAIDPLDGSLATSTSTSASAPFSASTAACRPPAARAPRPTACSPAPTRWPPATSSTAPAPCWCTPPATASTASPTSLSLGEFFLSHPDIQTPKTGTIYSINEGSSDSFSPGVAAFVQHCKEQQFLGPLHRLAGGRLPPQPAQGRHLHLPRHRQRPQGQAAPHVRVQPPGLHRGAGRRQKHQRPPPHHGNRAPSAATSAARSSSAARSWWSRPKPSWPRKEKLLAKERSQSRPAKQRPRSNRPLAQA